MFHCQLLVWSQLAVSEGFGGVTYCLADSNFGDSHGSVSYIGTHTFVSAHAAPHAYYIFIQRDIKIILQSDWRCPANIPAVRVIHQTCFHQPHRQTLKTRKAREITMNDGLIAQFTCAPSEVKKIRNLPFFFSRPSAIMSYLLTLVYM